MQKSKLIIFAIIIISLIVASNILNVKKENRLSIENKVTIKITTADSEEKKIQGYSNQPTIEYNEGMLFVYERPGRYPFWMKEMLFDLDFIFIKDNQIVYLIENVKAPLHNQGKIEYVNSPKDFDSALEVRAGFIEKYQVKINDKIQIHK